MTGTGEVFVQLQLRLRPPQQRVIALAPAVPRQELGVLGELERSRPWSVVDTVSGPSGLSMWRKWLGIVFPGAGAGLRAVRYRRFAAAR